MTKVHGSETLFFGTVVVYTPTEVGQSIPDIPSDYLNNSPYTIYFIVVRVVSPNEDKSPFGTMSRGYYPHFCATRHRNNHDTMGIAIFCIDCKRLACRLQGLVVDSDV